MFKNAVKILLSRFHQVWSLLLYYIVAVTVVSALGVTVLMPAITRLLESSIPAETVALFDSLLNGGSIQEFVKGLSALTSHIAGDLLTQPSVFGSLWIFVLVIIIVGRFIFGMVEYPTAVAIDGHMSENASYSFTGKFLLHSGRSSVYQLAKMLFSIPTDAVILFGLYGLSFLWFVAPLKFFTPLIMVAFFLFVMPLRYQLFSCWAPALISGQKKLFPAFASGAKIAFGKGLGLKIYSCYFVGVFLASALAVFLGVFTLGAGLFIFIPVSVLFFNILNNVVYYSYSGKRYYVDAETIINTPVIE